jgi:hypothetical protein
MELETALVKLADDAFNTKNLKGPSKGILIGLALSVAFFSTFAINSYAQGTTVIATDASQVLFNTILASAGILTAVATAVAWLLDRVKHSKIYSLMTERQRAFVDLASNIVNSLKGTDAGARDNAALLAILAKMTAQSPDAKKFLEDHQVSIEKFQANADQWTEDFNKLYVELQKIPEESSSDEIISAIGSIKKQTIPSDTGEPIVTTKKVNR